MRALFARWIARHVPLDPNPKSERDLPGALDVLDGVA